MPNSEEIRGGWNELKGKMKQKYAELTDDDLTYEEGREDEMWGKLEQKLGKAKKEILALFQYPFPSEKQPHSPKLFCRHFYMSNEQFFYY